MRHSQRANDQLRDIELIPHFNPYAEGSCLVKFGGTHVVCTASVEEKVPQWLKGQNKGWITSEYAMLPRSAQQQGHHHAHDASPSFLFAGVPPFGDAAVSTTARVRSLSCAALYAGHPACPALQHRASSACPPQRPSGLADKPAAGKTGPPQTTGHHGCRRQQHSTPSARDDRQDEKRGRTQDASFPQYKSGLCRERAVTHGLPRPGRCSSAAWRWSWGPRRRARA